ncbi:hypothetical protein LDENG_00205500 [Lucifuga dentata]|nr:hypothetical protein LDENG_00205500 [Lucifuga dentata]
MPYYQTWEEFTRAAEKLYLTDPMKVRVVLKYRHCDSNLCIKVTDNIVCLQYKTDQAQDVKKIEKLHGKLMRLMKLAFQILSFMDLCHVTEAGACNIISAQKPI